MKKTLIVYALLILTTVICMINELVNNDIKRTIMCIVCIIFMTVPFVVEKRFKLYIPSIIKTMIILSLDYSAPGDPVKHLLLIWS